MSARKEIVEGMAGKTIDRAEFVALPVDEESSERDRDRITLWFTDGTCVRLESGDSEGYISWIAVLETQEVGA